jgi:serine/threonine protein kinase
MRPSTSVAFVELVRKSGLVEGASLDNFLEQRHTAAALSQQPKNLAALMVQGGFLTCFQAEQLLRGKWRGYDFGKYRVLERLGRGSNSSVYLCQHLLMARPAAIKVLPPVDANNPAGLARFHREARAAAALDHPNIVHAYDSGQEGDLHFIVMEYVDGLSLQEIVNNHGSMDPTRAAHYIRQAALGLQHVFQSGLVHRDVKPANLLLDRRGIIRVLDLGLARFFHDHQDLLTQKYDGNSILGTADYLSPEQARDSHDVDIRTDVYSLGATFYFLLAGRPPFPVKSVTQKLLCHQIRQPAPIREFRPDVPETMADVLAMMMAKDRDSRYPNPAAVVAALTPWTKTAIAPPTADEMPKLCPAASTAVSGRGSAKRVVIAASKSNVPSARERTPALSTATAGVFDRGRTARGEAGADSGSSSSITSVSKKLPCPTNNGSCPENAPASADTDPALGRADTNPELAKSKTVSFSSGQKSLLIRGPIRWIIGGILALAAALWWLLS